MNKLHKNEVDTQNYILCISFHLFKVQNRAELAYTILSEDNGERSSEVLTIF